MQAGNRLPADRELAIMLQVSRPTVREALQLLEQRGLIEIHIGRGTFIKDISRSIIADSFERFFIFKNCTWEELLTLRDINEPEVAALAARNATPKDILKLRECLAIIEDVPGEQGIKPEIDTSFHETVAGATHNELIIALSCGLQQVMCIWLQAQYASTRHDSEINQTSIRVHRQIYEAIEAHDPEAARRAMCENMRLAHETLRLSKIEEEAQRNRIKKKGVPVIGD